MTTLKSLAQSVMLGTGSGFTPPVLEHVSISSPDPETALLASAALLGIGGMGGFKPLYLDGGEATCPVEAGVYLPERAADLLKRILVGEFEPVLPEFLQLAAACGLVAPPETLPALLGLGKKELRPLVVQLTGVRGRWLAGSNPAWAYALGREPQDAWEHGTRLERVTALERIRIHEPENARQWVQSSWEADAPEDRAAFIATFATGLCMDDESLLEACLDDKRREVRQAARGLLLRLERSRFVQRMWARARPLVSLKAKFLGGDKLEVILPEELDYAARRDGIGGLQLRKKMGAKANLLAQILSFVPPALWSKEFGKTPEKLIAAASNSEWAEPVLLGWQLAARGAKDPDWAEGIAQLWMTQTQGHQALDAEVMDEIILLVRVEKVEAWVSASIKPLIGELGEKSLLLSLLEKYRRPWTAKMARTIVRSAQRQSGDFRHSLPLALPGFAYWIPPDLAEEFATGWAAEPEGYWRQPINTFLLTLNFRREIRQSLI